MSFFAIISEHDSIRSFVKKSTELIIGSITTLTQIFLIFTLNFVGQIVGSCNAADTYSVGSCLLIVVMH